MTHQNAGWWTCLYFGVFLLASRWRCHQAQTYDNARLILKDKLSNTVYDVDVRPSNDQSATTPVVVGFEVITIVDVDDVGQKFLVNGFMKATWTDERIAWTPALYGGMASISPDIKRIWKPRVVLLNTLGDRDIFEDDHSPVNVDYTGKVVWAPGSLFPTSCELELRKYPFDEQTCTIELLVMNYAVTDIALAAWTPTAGTDFYVNNGEWELMSSTVEATTLLVDPTFYPAPLIRISFTVKRRPTIVLVTLVLPVVFISLLNVLVFLIPVESGEKIGYGITVLLALSVFLSIIAGTLPSSSETVPLVTIYLFCLLVMSVLTVVVSIIIVHLQNLEEKEERSIKAQENFQRAVNKFKSKNRNSSQSSMHSVAASLRDPWHSQSRSPPLTPGGRRSVPVPACYAWEDNSEQENGDPDSTRRRINKYKMIGRYVDIISLCVFFVIWLSLTLGFLLEMSL